MRFGWYIPLPGPFGVGGTLWRSKRRRSRRKVWHGRLADGWTCPHDHRREDTADACRDRELARRRRGI